MFLVIAECWMDDSDLTALTLDVARTSDADGDVLSNSARSLSTGLASTGKLCRYLHNPSTAGE